LNSLDIIFLIILGFSTYRGFNRGIIASVSSLAGYIIGLLGAALLYQPMAIFLGDQMGLKTALSPWVAEKIALPASSFETRINEMALDKAAELIDQQQLPAVFKDVMMEYVSTISELPVTEGIQTLGEGISYTLSTFLISALSFILLYAGLSIIFRIIVPKIFNTVNPRPVRFLDKLGGAAMGAAGGLLSVVILVAILTPVASLGAFKGNESTLAGLLSESVFASAIMTRMQGFF